MAPREPEKLHMPRTRKRSPAKDAPMEVTPKYMEVARLALERHHRHRKDRDRYASAAIWRGPRSSVEVNKKCAEVVFSLMQHHSRWSNQLAEGRILQTEQHNWFPPKYRHLPPNCVPPMNTDLAAISLAPAFLGIRSLVVLASFWRPHTIFVLHALDSLGEKFHVPRHP